ncbi:MAG: cob(I)yrinic acid a,c-diamide adenosyltransferase [Patescibacteria group bacterium]
MKVYTKTGDAGETSLYGGKRVRKSELRLSAYGTVDELNAVLGVVLAQPNVEIYQESLHKIQNDLFTLGSELASASAEVAQNLPKVEEARIEELEKEMDELSAELPELKNFIFPGGNQIAAHLHQARTVARRAERAVVKLSDVEPIRPLVMKYLNRLSDYLFILARHANYKLPNGKEIIWQKN